MLNRVEHHMRLLTGGRMIQINQGLTRARNLIKYWEVSTHSFRKSYGSVTRKCCHDVIPPTCKLPPNQRCEASRGKRSSTSLQYPRSSKAAAEDCVMPRLR